MSGNRHTQVHYRAHHGNRHMPEQVTAHQTGEIGAPLVHMLRMVTQTMHKGMDEFVNQNW
eukprot:scaffold153803_cov22-Tisochrysis_lutea.AAC.4